VSARPGGAALRRLAAYAMLPPLPHNTQPWRCWADGGPLTIGADAGRPCARLRPACSAASSAISAFETVCLTSHGFGLADPDNQDMK
jgi:hypothetical protein